MFRLAPPFIDARCPSGSLLYVSIADMLI